jgi:hypothetical protein
MPPGRRAKSKALGRIDCPLGCWEQPPKRSVRDLNRRSIFYIRIERSANGPSTDGPAENKVRAATSQLDSLNSKTAVGAGRQEK